MLDGEQTRTWSRSEVGEVAVKSGSRPEPKCFDPWPTSGSCLGLRACVMSTQVVYSEIALAVMGAHGYLDP